LSQRRQTRLQAGWQPTTVQTLEGIPTCLDCDICLHSGLYGFPQTHQLLRSRLVVCRANDGGNLLLLTHAKGCAATARLFAVSIMQALQAAVTSAD
jgi:hypothetical protein